MSAAEWTDVPDVDLEDVNAGLADDVPTAEVMIHVPSSRDPAHLPRVAVADLVDGVRHAQRIFGRVGVQIRLGAVRTGPLDPALLEVHATADRTPIPRGRWTGMYRAAERWPHEPSAEVVEAFERIIPPLPDGDRLLHLVVLQEVLMTFCEPVDERTWRRRTISTAGLSFPGYLYGDSLPRRVRGAITITDLTRNDRSWKTVAHELGHKLMNVSHEWRDVAPAHEHHGDGGLMLYGDGTEIPAGRAGRFHAERLHASPHLHRVVDGQRVWQPDYAEDGLYHDPIYDGMCVELDPPG